MRKPNVNRAAIYVKATAGNSSEGAERPTQMDDSEEFCKKRALDVAVRYSDDLKSREEFQRMMDDATGENPPFEHIVVWKLRYFSWGCRIPVGQLSVGDRLGRPLPGCRWCRGARRLGQCRRRDRGVWSPRPTGPAFESPRSHSHQFVAIPFTSSFLAFAGRHGTRGISCPRPGPVHTWSWSFIRLPADPDGPPGWFIADQFTRPRGSAARPVLEDR